MSEDKDVKDVFWWENRHRNYWRYTFAGQIAAAHVNLHPTWDYDHIAKESVVQADALLAELEEGKQ